MSGGDSDWGGYIPAEEEPPVPAVAPAATPTAPAVTPASPAGDAPATAARRTLSLPGVGAVPPRVLAVATVVVIAVIAVVGALAGSSSKSPAAVTPLSKPAFIAAADQICARDNPQLSSDYSAILRAVNSNDQAGEATAAKAYARDAAQGYGALRKLGEPAQGAATVNRLLADDVTVIHDIGNLNIAGAQQVNVDLVTQARLFGFRVCGVT